MTLRIPPLQALRALEAVARTGSLTRAADTLSVTHGAISHQLKGLEEALGVPLVERAGRGVRLTDEGERFASRVKAALAELAEAVREVAERRNPRHFRVSVMPSFAARWLLPRIGRFVAAHRDLDLDVRASASLVDFRRDDVDAAIRYGSGNYPGLVCEHLMDDAYFVACSPAIEGGIPGRPADLARYPLLRSENEFWEPWFRAAGLDWDEPSRGPKYEDASHLLQAAVEGQGVALARTSLIGNDLANGVLVRAFDISVPSPHRYFLVYPPRMADSPKLAAFRRWLKDEIAADPYSGARLPPAPRRSARRRART
ncbi:MAG: transcriptional regulator GcvA [Betaproteobacteria bacterium]|nr:transcriptional regulator GcvA [Betaproteobacteria bacterium]